jgi:hypothetical protein
MAKKGAKNSIRYSTIAKGRLLRGEEDPRYAPQDGEGDASASTEKDLRQTQNRNRGSRELVFPRRSAFFSCYHAGSHRFS